MKTKTTKNRYFLLYTGDSKVARSAFVNLGDALSTTIDILSDPSETKCILKEVTLREWVAEQLSWEDDGADPERDAAIYEWAAKLAAQDLEAEATEE